MEQLAQLLDGGDGPRRLETHHQRDDPVQGVVEEVRLELGPERREPRRLELRL
jgi:hypothetical protein